MLSSSTWREEIHERRQTRPNNKTTGQLTTASLKGGWQTSRHPGASTIGSQLLDETAPMAGQSWQPSHEAPRRREEGHSSHWCSIYSGEKGKGRRGETTQKLCSNVESRYNKHEGSTHMWTTEDRWPHRLTNAGSMDALAHMHEQTMLNARERRPPLHALVQVPHKTTLNMKERWHGWMHWCVCITNPQTLEGTQLLFVVNSVKLHLTALNPYQLFILAEQIAAELQIWTKSSLALPHSVVDNSWLSWRD